jgi:hypothetical protein
MCNSTLKCFYLNIKNKIHHWIWPDIEAKHITVNISQSTTNFQHQNWRKCTNYQSSTLTFRWHISNRVTSTVEDKTDDDNPKATKMLLLWSKIFEMTTSKGSLHQRNTSSQVKDKFFGSGRMFLWDDNIACAPRLIPDCGNDMSKKTCVYYQGIPLQWRRRHK